jgi:DNA (cytosine-5)-methyltransferase 1
MPSKTVKHLDLFSGIGGFALATEMVWPKVEHVFCDNEPFAQAILKKHWPDSPIYGDIRTLTFDSYTNGYGRAGFQTEVHAAEGREQAQHDVEGCDRTVAADSKHRDELTKRKIQTRRTAPVVSNNFDLLTGGFPCQPFSQAGRRRGTEDDRYLWPEMLRVIREFHPRWVVGENVGGFVTWNEGMVLEQVHADLEGEGYEVQAFIIPAVSVNAPHRRDRIWIVAHAESAGAGSESREIANQGRTASEDRRTGLRQTYRTVGTGGVEPTDINAPNTRRERRSKRAGNGMESKSEEPERKDSRHSDWDANWLEVATRLCRVDDGLPRRLDRTGRLKGLGNAIVPQVAAEIMKAIKQIDEYA